MLGSDRPTEEETPTQSESGMNEDGGDDDGEDPGERKRPRSTGSSLSYEPSSDYMIPDEGGSPRLKRDVIEAELQEPEQESNRPRIDEGDGEVKENSHKYRATAVRWADEQQSFGSASSLAEGEKSEEYKEYVRRIMMIRSVEEMNPYLKSEVPEYHDDEEVEMEELEEVEANVCEEEEEIPEWEDEEELNEKLPTWSNNFEDGPPKLTDEELENVDNESRAFEIERLEKMGVLKRLPQDADKAKYKFLSTKVVYDWRHREGKWQRRGRLVAREYKWLTSYDLASLFSPTGVSSTIKMLSAFFVSTEGYSLGSIDVSDTYLQVEQVEPTIVTVGDEDFELGFTLPGQRIGSSAWFGKLQGILEEYGLESLESDSGLPALFFRLPKDGKDGMILLSHVVDMEVMAIGKDFENLTKFMKEKKLKLKIEGPIDKRGGKFGFLKRSFEVNSRGVEVEMNSKYIEKLNWKGAMKRSCHVPQTAVEE